MNALATSVRQGEAGLCPSTLASPNTASGDAAGGGYGSDGWGPSTAEAFADRVLDEAELHAPGLTGLVLERHYPARC